MNRGSGKKDPDIGPESTREKEYIESFSGEPIGELLEAGREF